jgi:tetratricopeptide (TPR) repeat protein
MPIARTLTAVAAALSLAAVAHPVLAQADSGKSDELAAGDSAYVARDAPTALQHYQAAVAADSANYTALWKGSRSAIDLAEFEKTDSTRDAYLALGVALARHATTVNPGGTEGHFVLARALGREALTKGAKTRVRYAKEVRNEALESLKDDPKNAGAMHVLGVWNAEIMRLSGFERFFAKSFLGGGIFSQASWQNAIDYMQQAVANDSIRIIHHLDLAKIYQDTGDKAKARQEFQLVIDGPLIDYNDPHYKEDAQKRLAKLK